MLSYVKTRTRIFFKEGHERSLKVKKNVIITFLVKGASVPVSLLLVSMTIDYINPVQYGIWLTVSSIIGWLNFFDVGLGIGLKNKVTYSLAMKEYDDINKYVSTTYAVLTVLSLAFFVIFYAASFFFDWNKVLNLPPSLGYDIRPVIITVLSCFCIQFVVQTVNIILVAIHQPFKTSLMAFIGQLGTLIIIFFLTRNAPANLMVLVLVLAGFPIVVLLAGSIYLFKTEIKEFAPKIKNIEFKYTKGLLSTGSLFFFIQIGILILIQTDNIIITRLIGPSAVTNFNVSYKLFSILIMFFTIIVTPLWSAFTDAYAKKDYDWIKQGLKRMRQLWLLISVITIFFFIASKTIYKVWVGDSVVIPISLSLAMALYIMAYLWQSLHVYMLNGIGKLKLQLILVVISAVINIPLAVWLGNRFGLAGIVSANTIVFLIMGIILYVQCEKLINQTATGIWNK